jgi:hypothetical protein
MTPQDRLLAASKRALKVLDAIARGEYYGPSEDIQACRELYQAIAAVDAERATVEDYESVRRG